MVFHIRYDIIEKDKHNIVHISHARINGKFSIIKDGFIHTCNNTNNHYLVELRILRDELCIRQEIIKKDEDVIVHTFHGDSLVSYTCLLFYHSDIRFCFNLSYYFFVFE